MLATAVDEVDDLAFQLAGDLLAVERARQARVVDANLREAPAFEHRRDCAAHALDFG
jgi:hypothetical protein